MKDFKFRIVFPALILTVAITLCSCNADGTIIHQIQEAVDDMGADIPTQNIVMDDISEVVTGGEI